MCAVQQMRLYCASKFALAVTFCAINTLSRGRAHLSQTLHKYGSVYILLSFVKRRLLFKPCCAAGVCIMRLLLSQRVKQQGRDWPSISTFRKFVCCSTEWDSRLRISVFRCADLFYTGAGGSCTRVFFFFFFFMLMEERRGQGDSFVFKGVSLLG